MNNNLHGITTDFVDPRIRTGLQIVFGFIAIVLLVVMFLQQSVTVTDRGTGDEKQSANPPSVTVNRPEQATAAKTPGQTTQKMKSSAEVEVESALLEAKPTDEVADPTNAEPIDAQVAETQEASDEMAEPLVTIPAAKNQPEIIAGRTAPSYILDDPHQCFELAERHGCRFVIKSSALSVNAGRVLEKAQLRVIDATWHEQYSKRMIRVPDTPATRQAIRNARQRYQLGYAECYLSVPHDLDRAIYRAQEDFLGDGWDVTTTTIVEFIGRRPKVTGLLTKGESNDN